MGLKARLGSASRSPLTLDRRTCYAASTREPRVHSAALTRSYNFERPSAIQQRSIVPITQGRDVIAQAQSGTGKTATFSISILQSIDINVRETQALVLSPTRELATQIQAVCVAETK